MRNYLVNKTQYYLGYQIYRHQLSVHRNIYIYTICTLNFTLFMYTEKRQYIIFFFFTCITNYTIYHKYTSSKLAGTKCN